MTCLRREDSVVIITASSSIIILFVIERDKGQNRVSSIIIRRKNSVCIDVIIWIKVLKEAIDIALWVLPQSEANNECVSTWNLCILPFKTTICPRNPLNNIIVNYFQLKNLIHIYWPRLYSSACQHARYVDINLSPCIEPHCELLVYLFKYYKDWSLVCCQ